MDKLGLSINEAAEAVGISRASLYQQIRAGTGPEVIHLGRRALISRKGLETWFSSLGRGDSASGSSHK